ncbi:segregation and condensation protein A [Carboxydothermus hydrogenoformans]|uniref:Segregation and condensation protein A n=1 Tax=Carboxydothermus hydrogenoformans (strain ATCC BAA-161 / DSM 6008 / Z-2901) TaxID=246194 RepID=Q3AAR9_CARHZ|nr:segregation/condensation protein A [Carboxydothermus hydrogenoformans]ABB14160.1 segregation and condensation protein A [Carboxydothermus hydrogenoformans Z-2901]
MYKIVLPVFEGPLDLLLHLVEKNKIDIYDIPIAEITRQYLWYLEQYQKHNLEIKSEFLVMASHLLYLKVKMLFGKKEEEEDPRTELVERLVVYQKFREIAQYLKEIRGNFPSVYRRKVNVEELLKMYSVRELKEIPLKKLTESLNQTLLRLETSPKPITLPEKEYTIEEKMGEILRYLLRQEKALPFSQLFARVESKREAIILFLALLELLRQEVVEAWQVKTDGEIWIRYVGSVSNKS